MPAHQQLFIYNGLKQCSN